MCDSKELLVGYLYDELDDSVRRGFDTHLTTCPECRDELAGLRSTRMHLTAWAPPEPDFGFQIVRSPAALPVTRGFRVSPVWGFAAAAVLVMAVATAVANVEVRYGDAGLVVRTGWNRGASVEPGAPVPAGAPAASSPAVGALSAESVDWQEGIDHRLRELEAIARTQPSAGQKASTSISDVEVLQRVREMLGQSETRQERAVAVRIAEVTRELDAQRRIDLAAIDSGMARLQNTNGAEVKQYRDLIQRMYRATAYQQK